MTILWYQLPVDLQSLMTQYQYFGASLSIFLLVSGCSGLNFTKHIHSMYKLRSNILYENSKVIDNVGVENIGDNYNNADPGLGRHDQNGGHDQNPY